MRTGFITSLLWSRWGPFWEHLLDDAGLDVVRAEPDAVASALAQGDAQPDATPSFAFRVAVAEARALSDCDLIFAPDLNPGLAGGDAGGKGGGQDPWIVDFPTTLARSVNGLPPVRSLPATLEASVESLALEALLPLVRDPVRARRSLERRRATARPPKPAGVRWRLRPSELRTVALVGQPWWLGDATLAALAELNDRDDEHVISQHQLAPGDLREEGRRSDPDLIDTDAEAVGAARLFGRRGVVTELRVLIDPASGSDAWLLRRIREATRKVVTPLAFGDLAGDDDARLRLLLGR